ncbi:MAG: cytochrome c-type biogenesis protein CcmF [Oleiphilaceae bacterium]|jgi:cytochrome c-type biogenesis protein CcmF
MMLPEIGHYSLILGLALSILLGAVPMIGASINNTPLMKMARPLAGGQFIFILISFLILGYAFTQDDFSVQYVANHSNTLLPIQYKISAIWGGHEGSLLLWALILSGWTAAVVIFSKSLPLIVYARVLSVMGLIAVGFLFFILLTSNPFDRYLPQFPSEGSDLNPLLQDFGLIVHPPMLYMGYVGFSVAFSFAIAALLGGQLDAAWARWSRPWTTVAWAFLTLGIALGSWWAYYELGWGGWWFWDPVENASFMPWLVGAALIHSLAATEKRGVFKSWTVLLAILSFSLSLLGTFLVRSGVLTSVHAFASDPARGQFILALLGITLFCSLTLYAYKVPQVRGRIYFSLLSKETFLLTNNLLLIVAWVTVMLGTLYPLALDFVGGAKLSIGPPYFNALFVPIMSVLAVMMGFGIVSRWKDNSISYLIKKLRLAAILAVTVALVTPFVAFKEFHFGAFLGLLLFSWIVFVSIQDVIDKSKSSQGFFYGVRRLRPAYFGMMCGHIGFAITLLGVAMVSIESDERDIRLSIGDQAQVQNYIFEFDGMEKIEGPNYIADRASFIVMDSETKKVISYLKPEKRLYLAKNMPMTEAAIDPGVFRDLYVALGEKLEDGAWAVRIQIKPFVRWIWFGALIMGLGGLLAVSDKRYRTT